MKTFRWTFPDLPMTSRERRGRSPGGDKRATGFARITFALFFLLMGLFRGISAAPEFFEGLRSYGWEETEAEITGLDLRVSDSADRGDVSFRLKGETEEKSDYIYRRWRWVSEEKRKAERAKLVEGATVSVFVSEEGKFSLGHWPDRSVVSEAFAGVGFFGLGLANLIWGLRERREGLREDGSEEG